MTSSWWFLLGLACGAWLGALLFCGAACADDVRVVLGARARDGSQAYNLVIDTRSASGIDLLLRHPMAARPGSLVTAGIARTCTAIARSTEARDELRVSIACGLPLIGDGVIATFGLSRRVPVRDIEVVECAIDEQPCGWREPTPPPTTRGGE